MKTIFDLLSIDLKSLPNADSVEIGKRTNSAGQQVTEFNMALNNPELGLFKLLNILQIADGNMNVGFSNPNLASIKIPALEKLINTLYSFYGNDSNQTPLGAFTSNDQYAIQGVIDDPMNGFWIGRMWYPGDHAVMLSIDDEGLCLFIHGVNKKK